MGGWQHLPQQLQALDLRACRLKQLPAELGGLTQLSELSLMGNPIEGGWQHVPRQLRQLNVSDCGLKQVPAELAGSGTRVIGIALND